MRLIVVFLGFKLLIELFSCLVAAFFIISFVLETIFNFGFFRLFSIIVPLLMFFKGSAVRLFVWNNVLLSLINHLLLYHINLSKISAFSLTFLLIIWLFVHISS